MTNKQLLFLLPANEVWGKVICLQVSVHRGVLVLGVPTPGGACSGGLLLRGVPGGDPPGQLPLRAVHILLECILVYL